MSRPQQVAPHQVELEAVNALCDDLERKIIRDEAYAECRRVICAMKQGEAGIFWLRDFFNDQDHFSKENLPLITPENLLPVLQGSLQTTLAAREATGGSNLLHPIRYHSTAQYIRMVDLPFYRGSVFLDSIVQLMNGNMAETGDNTQVVCLFTVTFFTDMGKVSLDIVFTFPTGETIQTNGVQNHSMTEDGHLQIRYYDRSTKKLMFVRIPDGITSRTDEAIGVSMLDLESGGMGIFVPTPILPSQS